MSRNFAYLRVSTDTQDLKNQKFEILNYCHRQKLRVNKWLSIEISSKRSTKDRRIDELLALLKPGDRLIVSELSRLGRSTGEVIQLINQLSEMKVELIAIKQSLKINTKNRKDMTSKVMVTIFSLLAELERDLISERTRTALAQAKAAGKKLGRPKGPGKSKLDGREDEIKDLLSKGVTKANIARILGVAWGTLDNHIKKKKL
jgi:DNA invertase Pin-like site-specific DNA recombinase